MEKKKKYGNSKIPILIYIMFISRSMASQISIHCHSFNPNHPFFIIARRPVSSHIEKTIASATNFLKHISARILSAKGEKWKLAMSSIYRIEKFPIQFKQSIRLFTFTFPIYMHINLTLIAAISILTGNIQGFLFAVYFFLYGKPFSPVNLK